MYLKKVSLSKENNDWGGGGTKNRTNDKGGNAYLSSDVPFHFGVHAAYALWVDAAVVFVRCHTVVQRLIIAQRTNRLGLRTFQKRHARKLVWTQTSKKYFTKMPELKWNGYRWRHEKQNERVLCHRLCCFPSSDPQTRWVDWAWNTKLLTNKMTKGQAHHYNPNTELSINEFTQYIS